jgi:hypothetical protein
MTNALRLPNVTAELNVSARSGKPAMPAARVTPEPFEAPPPEIIYWRWVCATALAAVASAALSYTISEVVFAGPPPKPLVADVVRTLTDAVPLALAQGTVLSQSFRVSRLAYMLWSVLPMLLASAPIVLRNFYGVTTPEVADATAASATLNPGLMLVAFMVIILSSLVLAMASAGLQWLALRERVSGLGSWLMWNAVGYGALSLFMVGLMPMLGIDELFGFVRSSGSVALYVASPVLMIAANALVGIGACSLKLKDSPQYLTA